MSCARTRGRRSPAGAPRCRARHRAASRCLTVMHATSCSLLARRSRLLFSSGSATTRTGARTLRTGGTWSGTTRLTSTPTTWDHLIRQCAPSLAAKVIYIVFRLLQVQPCEERRVLPVLTPFASATRRPSSLHTRRRHRSTLDRRSDSPLACVAGLRPTDGARGAPRGGRRPSSRPQGPPSCSASLSTHRPRAGAAPRRLGRAARRLRSRRRRRAAPRVAAGIQGSVACMRKVLLERVQRMPNDARVTQ